MTRNHVRQYPVGTAEHVIAHATWRAQRGRRPSMTYGDILNPREALQAAQSGSPPPRKQAVTAVKVAPPKKQGKTLALSLKGWYAELAHQGLSEETKRLLRAAIRAFRHDESGTEATIAQYAQVTTEVGCSVQLNGERLVLTWADGQLKLQPLN